ncbi:unnamed protein product [Arabidopsis lyrata]|nr:unnamed protein product [Arabidopsis lyrata]
MMVFDQRHLDRFIFGPPWSFNGRICGYQLDSRVLRLIAVVFGDPFERFWSWEGTNIVVFFRIVESPSSSPTVLTSKFFDVSPNRSIFLSVFRCLRSSVQSQLPPPPPL